MERQGKVLVTGAGTLGRELVRQLTRIAPVNVLDHSEDALWRCEEANPRRERDFEARYYLGDISDARDVARTMSGVTHIINTAAIKHVRFALSNHDVCIRTNVGGLATLLEAARRENVERFVHISTDKVCHAENVYGASKAIGEHMVDAASRDGYLCCRFGNFLGSQGSVFDRWRVQREDHAIRLTDPAMNRFFIRPAEVAQFVVDRMRDRAPRGVYVPRMKVFNMGEVAEVYAERFGCGIETIGSGKGEKREEVIVTLQEAARTTMEPWGYHIHPSDVAVCDPLSCQISTENLPRQTKAETERYLEEVMR